MKRRSYIICTFFVRSASEEHIRADDLKPGIYSTRRFSSHHLLLSISFVTFHQACVLSLVRHSRPVLIMVMSVFEDYGHFCFRITFFSVTNSQRTGSKSQRTSSSSKLVLVIYRSSRLVFRVRSCSSTKMVEQFFVLDTSTTRGHTCPRVVDSDDMSLWI